MKLNDVIWGALCLLLGATLLVHVQSFPTIPGQQYGPALMPGMVGLGLCVCGVLLVLKGAALRRVESGRMVQFAPWTRVPGRLLAFGVSVAVNIFYIYAVGVLGFVVTGTVYLAAMFAVLGVKPARIVPLALVITVVIHYVFYKLLRVPLPWGILQGVAWY